MMEQTEITAFTSDTPEAIISRIQTKATAELDHSAGGS